MKAALLIAFTLVVAAQWYVPVSMIRDSELIVTEGLELKFRTRPVDPSDPFRGKYITLYFGTQSFVMDTVPRYNYGDDIYAALTIDEDGYAVVDSLYADEPADEMLAIKVEVSSAYIDSTHQLIEIQYPFDRFYVEESKASEAERLYWESLLPTLPERQTYAVVRVRKRRAVLMDVRIADKSIVDIVREINADSVDVAR